MTKDTLIENLLITDIADDGQSLGRHNNMVVFVAGAVPGDIVNVEIFRKKKSFANAKILQLVEPSSYRTEAFCSHFGFCGGCKWQYMNYDAQLQFKQKQVYDALTRIGKFENVKINDILPSEDTRYYRNKLEFSFSDKKFLVKMDDENEKLNMNSLGFHIPKRFDKVLDIHECFLQDDLSNKIRNFVRDFCFEHHFSFMNLRDQKGFMRTLTIRNTAIGEWMVKFSFKEEHKENREKLLQAVKEKFPEITSLMYVINDKMNDSSDGLQFECFSGRPYIIEQFEDLKFRIGANSFFQTNSKQALNLYRIARGYAQLTGNEHVYDLYTGTGTIAQFVAKNAAHVTGIEYVANSIEDAKANALLNNISNTSFYAGDMKDLLTQDFYQSNGYPDVIITDPPRNGMEPAVVKMLHESFARRIVYVSCNVATQARDLEMLKDNYTITSVQPVDMFPHTSHVENVVLLTKK